MIIAEFIAAALVGYILGSIPAGVIVSRAFARVDVREYGSGKTGTTNVLRTAGRKAAALALAMDMGKGALAVVIAGLIVGPDSMTVGGIGLGAYFARGLAALAAVAGHIWPVFVKFRGGRGVATFMGSMAALCPPAALFGGGVFAIGAGLSGYASLGSLAGVLSTYAILVSLIFVNGSPVEYCLYTAPAAILVIVMHRDNIARLLAGTERRLSEKVKGPESRSFGGR